jgi:hypothetical protein
VESSPLPSSTVSSAELVSPAHFSYSERRLTWRFLDISLISPLFASLAKHVSEIGIRMGLAFSVLSLAGLAGTPITGALLTSELKWARPIAFSAVRLSLLFSSDFIEFYADLRFVRPVCSLEGLC